MTLRLVHVRGHDRKPPIRKSLALTPPHLEFVASNDVMGNLLAHAVELELGRFSSPELRKIESEDAGQARRIEESW